MLVLIQVSSMKTSRAGSRWRLARSHLARLFTTSGRSCSVANSVFFERLAFAAQEAPNSIVRGHDAALGQQVFQAMQRQMRHLLDLRENKATMRRQAARLVAAKLGWRRAPRLAHALCPLHHRRGGDAEARGDRPAGLASSGRSGNTRSQVSGIGLRHAYWPPSSSMQLESEPH